MKQIFVETLLGIVAAAGISSAGAAEFRYDRQDPGPAADPATHIQPWATVELDRDYAGQWVVTGDIDADGDAEVVSARNVNQGDVHFTSAVVAQELNGDLLWRWGDPRVGRRQLHHDVACQIYDWDRDGTNEVVLLANEALVHLDGRTGQVRRRFPIPPQASDSLVFAHLSGKDRPADVLVKTRYSQIWAFDYAGQQLWTATQPGGYRTAHQPRPMDLDGDGIDEILAGYTLLNSHGEPLWTYESKLVDLQRGHLDACRVFSIASAPEITRLVVTCCGANNVAMIDGNGHPVWEYAGHHFESLRIGELDPDSPGNEILVDIDHVERGKSPIWILSSDGIPMTRITSQYCRHHNLVDWNGDGVAEIVIAQSRGLFNHRGERIATFHVDPKWLDSDEILVSVGDMTGDGIADVTLSTLSAVCVYKNPHLTPSKNRSPMGSGVNFTLY
jgi:hypothetical protein